MKNLLNKLLLGLASGIFSAINGCYSMFYGLATTKVFSNETIRQVSNNLYILVSVVILFAFSVKLIEAIVNPDLLTDAKKGVTGVLKRTIIGLLLIVAVPTIFNVVYVFQYEIITNSLIEKLILNYSDSNSAGGMSSAGGTLTSAIISGFIVPVDENGVQITESMLCGDDPGCNYADSLKNKNEAYEPYLSYLGDNPDYENLSDLNIDGEWEGGEPLYSVQALFLVVVGVFVLYQIITLCFDTALRLVNLGILEMIAPVVIVAYMGGGTEYLGKWAKMTLEKFLSVFFRIAGLAFMVKGFQLINDPNSIFNNQSATVWFKILVIIGLLRLIKDLPNIIEKIFGVDIKDPGGIKGRLGEMAGIGGLAQKAWSGLGGLAKTAGIAAGAGAVGAIKNMPKIAKGIGKGVKEFDDKTGISNRVKAGIGKRIPQGVKDKYSAAKSAVGTATGKVKGAVDNVKGNMKAKSDAFKASHPSITAGLEFAGEKMKLAGKGIVSNVKRVPAGVKTLYAGAAAGGKYSAIKKAYEENFSDIKYQQEKNRQLEERNKFSGKVENATGILKAEESGKMEYNYGAGKKGSENAKQIIENGGATKVGADLIANASSISFSEPMKKELTKLNETVNDFNEADLRQSNREKLISSVKNLMGQVSSTTDQAILEELANRIEDGGISQQDIETTLKTVNFGDKAKANSMLDGLVASGVADAVLIKEKFNKGEYSNEDELKKALVSAGIYEKDANGNIVDTKAADLAKMIFGADSNTASATFIDQINKIAQKEGAIGDFSLDDLIVAKQTAQEEKDKAVTAIDDRIKSLDKKRAAEFKQYKGAIEKIAASEKQSKQIGKAEFKGYEQDANGNDDYSKPIYEWN